MNINNISPPLGWVVTWMYELNNHLCLSILCPMLISEDVPAFCLTQVRVGPSTVYVLLYVVHRKLQISDTAINGIKEIRRRRRSRMYLFNGVSVLFRCNLITKITAITLFNIKHNNNFCGNFIVCIAGLILSGWLNLDD